MPQEFAAYIAGHWTHTAERRELRAPFDGSHFATVDLCGAAELEDAIAAGVRAAPAAAALSSYERASILRAVAAGVRARREELALGMCYESGKPIGDAFAEVDRAEHCFELAAAEAERIYGEVIPLDLRPASAGRWGLTRRFPIGLVAGIAPFNFPLNLAVHKVAPAMAAGCPIVLKPATQTPTSMLRLAEIIDGTAWPKGALSVVPATREAADVLTTDERIALLSFTGSAEVGWRMKARAGKKKVVLELGGNAAAIVDESADLDFAIPKLVYGAFSYAGQKCISVQRIFVHARRWDEFVPALRRERPPRQGGRSARRRGAGRPDDRRGQRQARRELDRRGAPPRRRGPARRQAAGRAGPANRVGKGAAHGAPRPRRGLRPHRQPRARRRLRRGHRARQRLRLRPAVRRCSRAIWSTPGAPSSESPSVP